MNAIIAVAEVFGNSVDYWPTSKGNRVSEIEFRYFGQSELFLQRMSKELYPFALIA